MIQILLKYPCRGNIGQLKNDIKIIPQGPIWHVINGERMYFIDVDDVSEDMRRELYPSIRGYRINQPDDYIKVGAYPGTDRESIKSLYQMMDEQCPDIKGNRT